MTYDQYIQNPMGIANAVISNREMYRKLYSEKLDKILVREAGKIDYKLYSIGRKYLAYLKIPSEVVPNFYYDVLIEFHPPKGAILGASLKDYEIKFFSNDPSFVFTFAHAFIKNKIFIPWLEGKMSKEAVTSVAKEKNPKNQVGYVKSLYFAYLIMSKRGLFNKARYVDPFFEKAVLKDITPASKKIEDRQELATKQGRAKKRTEVATKRKTDRDNIIAPTQMNISDRPTAVRKTKVTGSVNKTKPAGKYVKTTKRK